MGLFVGDDAGQNDGADDGKLQVCGNPEDIDRVVKHAQHGGTDDHAGDGAFATPEAATAENGRGDGVELIEFAETGGLDGIDVQPLTEYYLHPEETNPKTATEVFLSRDIYEVWMLIITAITLFLWYVFYDEAVYRKKKGQK